MSRHSKHNVLMTVEGNIASGKSTFLDYLKEFPKVILLKEPVELWENFHGTNLLKQKYEHPSDRNEYMFQTLVNTSRLNQLHTSSLTDSIKITERSLHSAFNVFVKNSHENSNISNLSYELLKYNYEVCTQGAIKKYTNPDLLVYIKTTPDVCLQRLQGRKRLAESTVDLAYLTQIHNAHEKWLFSTLENESYGIKPSILTIDGNQNPKRMQEEAKRVYEEILNIKDNPFTVNPLAHNPFLVISRCNSIN